jgi:glutaminyl-peptide cyclotransferase
VEAETFASIILRISDLSLLKMKLFCAMACLGIVWGPTTGWFASNQLYSQTTQPAVAEPETRIVPASGPPIVSPAEPAKQPTVTEGQFNGNAAFEYLKTVCDFGPRMSLSDGMRKQQEFLKTHFEQLGAAVTVQPFNARDPNSGNWIQLSNMVVRWNPERKIRLLICCHYDTRPFPDRDPVNPRGVFIGANDGGSGVAVLCELGKHVAQLDGKYGIDFVFFDGEEYVFVAKRDPMFLGSTYFANQYATQRFDWKYQFGVLLDMVGDANLQIHYEGNSLGYASRLTRSIWGVAKELGVKEFVPNQRHKIRDDHLPLNQIARIETCDIIDFDFPDPNSKNAYWHTQNDTVEHCSADSLGKVGVVVLEWLRQMQRLNRGR